MLIYNTYLNKYVKFITLSIAKHTDNKKEALKLSKKDARHICNRLNTTGYKHYEVVAE